MAIKKKPDPVVEMQQLSEEALKHLGPDGSVLEGSRLTYLLLVKYIQWCLE